MSKAHEIHIGDIIYNWKVLDFIYTPIKNKNYSSKKLKVECQLCMKSISITPPYQIVNGKRNGCKKCGFANRIAYNAKDVGEISLGYYHRIKRDAETRNLEFLISQEDIWNLYEFQLGECALTGKEIYLATSYNSKDRTASLDRIDSSKGYVKGNIQWIHKDINQMKWNFDQDLFIQRCIEVVKYYKQGFNKYHRTEVL